MEEVKNIQYGWVCPKCGKANAPWNRSCSCVTTPVIIPNTPYNPIDPNRIYGPIDYDHPPTYEVTCNG